MFQDGKLYGVISTEDILVWKMLEQEFTLY